MRTSLAVVPRANGTSSARVVEKSPPKQAACRHEDSRLRNGTPPRATLGLFKIRAMRLQNARVSQIADDIVVIDSFLSEPECNRILKQLKLIPWQPSLTYRQQEDGIYRNVLSGFRTSETAHEEWFGRELKFALKEIETRLRALFDLQIANLEPWQATDYSRLGKFDYHLDAGYWDGHYAGDRILTFLLYLTTPIKGGGTHFRALDVHVEAKSGRLLVWNNLFTNGQCNHGMVHSGTPLIKGSKTTLATWLRQRAYRLKRKTSFRKT
jgi:prolyl 4-hydroxylase